MSRTSFRNRYESRELKRHALVARALCYGLFTVLFSIAAFGQCTFTVNPSSPVYVDSLGHIDLAGNPLVIQITASAETCAWTADANDGFATVSGADSGTGNGSVTFSITENKSGADQSVSLMVAGNAVTLTQRFTATTFSDVELGPSSPYFNGANLLRTNNITAGCRIRPVLYCPDQNVTRGEMAIFIVRTILGGGPAVDNFSYSSMPYFTDVPATHEYFKWIQKLRDLGVTAGCTVTTYCPDANIPRNQMAIFIVRARLGSTAKFTYDSTPYFTDEPATDTSYFKYIQKLKDIGITAGCTATTYCPNDLVTRGQMAIFLVWAGFNDLLSGTAPLITSVVPNDGAPGQSVSVHITGINTHFASDTTVVAENGVKAGTPGITDATHLSVTLTIPSGTPPGQISLTAKTPSASDEDATITNGFTNSTPSNLPSVVIDAPGANAALAGTVEISGWAMESIKGVGPNAVNSVTVFVDGTEAGKATYGGSRPDVCTAYAGRRGCPNIGWNYNLNVSALATGDHMLKIVATDSEGNSGSTQTTFTTSFQPSVLIDAPGANAILSGTVQISGWALENASVAAPNAVKSVTVFVDGTQVGTAKYGSSRQDVCAVYPGRPSCPNVGWSYNLNVSSLSSGRHALNIVATDSAGNKGSVQVTFLK